MRVTRHAKRTLTVKPPLAHNILSFMMRVTWEDHRAFSIEHSASVPRDKVALTTLLHSCDYHHARATRALAKATMRVSSSARKRWACMHLNSSDIRRPEDRTGRHGYKVRQPWANVVVAHLRTKEDSSISGSEVGPGVGRCRKKHIWGVENRVFGEADQMNIHYRSSVVRGMPMFGTMCLVALSAAASNEATPKGLHILPMVRHFLVVGP